MSEDPTLPPVTPRSVLTRIWQWCASHREYSIPAAAFVVGAVAGKLL